MPNKKAKVKMLSNQELRDKIREGKDFHVATVSERKRALMVASVLDIPIMTREADGGGFSVFIRTSVPS